MSRFCLTAISGLFGAIAVAAAAAASFPDVIPLPSGWRPEGVEAGRANTLYVGSISSGAVRQIDARTGDQFTLVQPIAGRSAIGLEYDRKYGRLFVAGGGTGQAYVYDVETGAPIAAYTLTPTMPTFINDAVLTDDAVYFTESRRPWLYRLPLGPRGELPAAAEVETIPLAGDYLHGTGNNLNGIVATKDGETLIAIQSNTATLLRIDPETGVADRIEITGGDATTNGDGLLLEGHTLYIVQNRLNRVAVVELSRDYASGTVIEFLTHSEFDVPTTIDRLGSRLYLPNARFGIPDADAAEYDVIKLGKG
jgi:streptogramin lyase